MNTLLKWAARLGLPLLFCLAATPGCQPKAFTAAERAVILEQDSLLQVMVLPQDSVILRAVSRDLGPEELQSAELKALISKMLYTVQDPSQDGVGIAAPQVGINRRLVCVQRFDLPGEPFQAYPNIRLDSLGGEMVVGPEGCLSVPDRRGLVPRHSEIQISYADLATGERRSETVRGFTAVIFQHECDHLDGILYIDKADSVWVDKR